MLDQGYERQVTNRRSERDSECELDLTWRICVLEFAEIVRVGDVCVWGGELGAVEHIEELRAKLKIQTVVP